MKLARVANNVTELQSRFNGHVGSGIVHGATIPANHPPYGLLAFDVPGNMAIRYLAFVLANQHTYDIIPGDVGIHNREVFYGAHRE